MKVRMLRINGVLILGILALALVGCGGQAPSAATAEPTGEIPAVRAADSVIAEGRVIPARDSSLSFTTGGVVGKVLVTEGDVVAEGQPLIQLVGNEKLQAAIAAAELEVISAQQALDD